jgi:hypothetical protein
MSSRLMIAYGLIAFLAVAVLVILFMALRRRRAEHNLRWGNKKRWKQRP